MDAYTHRLLGTDDVEEITNLFSVTFNISREPAFFRWKYFSNPAGETLLAGIFHDGKLVGSGAMMPDKMRVFDKDMVVYKCTDLMTHPLHQRKGLSKSIVGILMSETKKLNPPFCYALCAATSTRILVRNGWDFIEEVINFFKPYALLKANHLIRTAKLSDFGIYHAVEDHLNNYPFASDNSGIQLIKDTTYLKWRISNPDYSYRIICSYDKQNRVNGYLLCSLGANSLLSVIDMDLIGHDEEALDHLLLCAEAFAIKEKHKGILIPAVRNTPFHDYIKDKNYLRNPFSKGPLKKLLDFNIHVCDKSAGRFDSPQLWNITAIAYDDI